MRSRGFDFDNFDRSFERHERNFWRAWWVILFLVAAFWGTIIGVGIYALLRFT